MKFYPALDAWFRERFPEFSVIQKRALPHTMAGRNTLILAPTGSGKTLAAFLSVLSDLASRAAGEGLPNAVCSVYVSPLKALDRDIHRNLSGPLEAINRGLPEARRIRMEVRTGDTDASARGRQQRRRPHLLLTTPESLSSILSQAQWRDGGFDPRHAIVDEIHAFAENKRGSLLALALERLEQHSAGPIQRIGLSATAWPVEAVKQLLCGARECSVAQVDLKKAHQLDIAELSDDLALPPAGYNPFRIAQPVADLVVKARCSLIFTATRSAAERLGLALKILLPDLEEKIEVHHGSLDMDARLGVETQLAAGALRAVVCSTSLELGVDFEYVDQVLLIGAPRGVSRALQRLGRSGHRVGGVARGVLVPLSLPDLVECVAIRNAASQGRLDALRVPQAPLDVLAQSLLGMSIERPWDLEEAFGVVRKSGPYQSLTREDFDAVIEFLAGGGKVLGPYGTYGKIVITGNRFAVASRQVARAYYMNAGVISDSLQIKVVTRANRRLGEVEEEFLASLQPREAFLMAGKPVAVKMLHRNIAVVEPAKGERVRTPRWLGGKMPLSSQLAREEVRLRADLRKGRSAAELARAWKVSAGTANRIAEFVRRQTKAAPVPAGEPVQIERVREKRALLILFHVVAGRAVNRSLAWVLASRLPEVGSIVANFDDHNFLLSVDAKRAPDLDRLRSGFNPERWVEDLEHALNGTEMLGRRFRAVAEIGQLLPRNTLRGHVPAKSSSWSGSLLYQTLREHEPDHPLVREAVREALEDQCDAPNALCEAARIFHAKWEVYDLPRPSPFALPLFTAFNRETLVKQDADRALEDLATELYEQWPA
jgi:ATP-dependent Lhr-like helicase